MPTTTRLGLPYPVLAGSANVPADIQALAVALDDAALYTKGVFASRPAAVGIPGRFYWATDQSKLYVNDGTTWLDITPGTLGTDSVTAAMIQANAVGASELADGAVDTAALQALAVTNSKLAAGAVDSAVIAASLKPSGGAGGGTESLRALGLVAGTALSGDVVSTGKVAGGSNYGTVLPTTGLFNGYRFTLIVTDPVSGFIGWELIYRTDLDATYPWHVLGGPPLFKSATANSTGGWNTIVSFTAPFSGRYLVRYDAEGDDNGTGGGQIGFRFLINGVAYKQMLTGNNENWGASHSHKLTVGAGQTVAFQGNSGGSAYTYIAELTASPSQVG